MAGRKKTSKTAGKKKSVKKVASTKIPAVETLHSTSLLTGGGELVECACKNHRLDATGLSERSERRPVVLHKKTYSEEEEEILRRKRGADDVDGGLDDMGDKSRGKDKKKANLEDEDLWGGSYSDDGDEYFYEDAVEDKYY